MIRLVISFLLIASISIGGIPTMALTNSGFLSDCITTTNCVLFEQKFSRSNDVFRKLVSIASSLQRVEVIEDKENYWHAVIKSLIFRFPDDLEILHIPSSNIIQVRSASRIGIGDLGVNQKRINNLYREAYYSRNKHRKKGIVDKLHWINYI